MSEQNSFSPGANRLFRNARVLCRVGVLAALYLVLTLVSVRAGNLRLTFASLPVAVSALLFGPGEACTVALLGETLNQFLSYGPTVTTLLWIVPPAVRGLTIGLAARHARRAGRPLEDRPRVFFAVCLSAAVLTTLANTAAILADSLLYGYYTPAVVFGTLAVRMATGLLTAAAVAVVTPPLARLLRRRVADTGEAA